MRNLRICIEMSNGSCSSVVFFDMIC